MDLYNLPKEKRYFSYAKDQIRAGRKDFARRLLTYALNVRDGRHEFYDHRSEKNYLPKPHEPQWMTDKTRKLISKEKQ